MDDFSNYIVGAYATSPALIAWEPKKETDFILGLRQRLGKIRGLELPFWGDGIHPYDTELFLSLLDPEWEYVLTCLPGNMQKLAENKHFGLASDDESGRQQALNFYKNASETIKSLNQYFGSRRVFAVAIATSPALHVDGVSSSTTALEKSLLALASFDWNGAKLVIEHCDSGRLARKAVKGFLSIEEELVCILNLRKRHSVDVGMTINWGRSVIEVRDEIGANQHILKALHAGVLYGLMFSGTSSVDSIYGQWSDLHLPIAEDPEIDHFEKSSLMTASHIKSCLIDSNFKQLHYLGVKLLSMPIESSSLERRIGVNFDALKILNRTISEL